MTSCARFAWRLLFPVCAALPLTSCGSCANDIVQIDFSPGNEQQAVVFWRTCGEDAAGSTHVSVIDGSGELPTGEGNIVNVEGKLRLTAFWEDRGLLVINGLEGQAATRKAGEHQNMKIEYR